MPKQTIIIGEHNEIVNNQIDHYWWTSTKMLLNIVISIIAYKLAAFIVH
jgi:hypothetical protein